MKYSRSEYSPSNNPFGKSGIPNYTTSPINNTDKGKPGFINSVYSDLLGTKQDNNVTYTGITPFGYGKKVNSMQDPLSTPTVPTSPTPQITPFMPGAPGVPQPGTTSPLPPGTIPIMPTRPAAPMPNPSGPMTPGTRPGLLTQPAIPISPTRPVSPFMPGSTIPSISPAVPGTSTPPPFPTAPGISTIPGMNVTPIRPTLPLRPGTPGAPGLNTLPVMPTTPAVPGSITTPGMNTMPLRPTMPFMPTAPVRPTIPSTLPFSPTPGLTPTMSTSPFNPTTPPSLPTIPSIPNIPTAPPTSTAPGNRLPSQPPNTFPGSLMPNSPEVPGYLPRVQNYSEYASKHRSEYDYPSSPDYGANNIYMTDVSPYHVPLAVPMMPLYGYDNCEDASKDFGYMKHLYPEKAKKMMVLIEEECDKLEYDGSCMFDEYPDRVYLGKLVDKIYNNLNPVKEASLSDSSTVDKTASGYDNWMRDMTEVLLYNEMLERRKRYRGRKRWF